MTAPYIRTVVRFISSYAGIADYGVTLAGTDTEKRVSVDHDGRVYVQHAHRLSGDEERTYVAALLAHLSDERECAERWARERDMTAYLGEKRQYTPVYIGRSL